MGKKCFIFSVSTCITIAVVAVAVAFNATVIVRLIYGDTEFTPDQMVLHNDSRSWPSWTYQDESKVKSKLNVYLFNIVNPREVENGELAQLQEIGPFVFDLKRRKKIKSITRDKIEYIDHESFVFNPVETVAPLNSLINTVDLLLLNIVNCAPNAGSTYHLNAVVKTTAEEMLFDWPFARIHQPRQRRATEQCTSPNFNPIFRDDIKKHEIRTTYEALIANRGADDIDHVARIDHLCPNERFDSDIDVTDGTLFRPGLKSTSSVSVATRDLCARLPLIHKSNVSSTFGTTLFQFIVDDAFYQPGVKECICPESDCHGEIKSCVSGVVKVTTTKDFKYFLVSRPHFFRGSGGQMLVNGLRPEQDKHETYFKIEPMSGLVVESKVRTQFNVLLQKNRDLDPLRKVKNAVIPVYWQERIYQKPLPDWLNRPDTDYIIWSLKIGGGVAAVFFFGTAMFLIGRRRRLIKSPDLPPKPQPAQSTGDD